MREESHWDTFWTGEILAIFLPKIGHRIQRPWLSQMVNGSEAAHGHPESLKDTMDQLPMRNWVKPALHDLKSLYRSVNWQMKHAKDKTLKDFFQNRKNYTVKDD